MLWWLGSPPGATAAGLPTATGWQGSAPDADTLSRFLTALDERTVHKRAVVLLYGIDPALLEAADRLESGRAGHELGYDSHTHLSAYGNPCLPDGAWQYGRYALAHVQAMQAFILHDEERRREYFRYFATWYHGGGRGTTEAARTENNRVYARDMNSLYRTCRRALRGTAYLPWAASTASGYCP